MSKGDLEDILNLKKKAVANHQYELAEYLKRSEETLRKTLNLQWVEDVLTYIKADKNEK